MEGIARGIAGEDVDHLDLTLPEGTEQPLPPFSDELVILGGPVYGGRLPTDAVARFKTLKADNTPAVLVVLYGNREFEDALLEFRNLALELGFVPIAGAAFIGEHSFSTAERPIADGRPDEADLIRAVEFGAKIRAKAAALDSPGARPELEVPGRFPYESKGARPMAVAPVTKVDRCTVCGECATVCPTAAIAIDESVTTETELCIRCSACIKICPEEARLWEDEMMAKITTWLYENCSERKEPELFGVG